MQLAVLSCIGLFGGMLYLLCILYHDTDLGLWPAIQAPPCIVIAIHAHDTYVRVRTYARMHTRK